MAFRAGCRATVCAAPAIKANLTSNAGACRSAAGDEGGGGQGAKAKAKEMAAAEARANAAADALLAEEEAEKAASG